MHSVTFSLFVSCVKEGILFRGRGGGVVSQTNGDIPPAS